MIRALNRAPLVFGIDWKIYLIVLFLAVVFFLPISNLAAFLLLFVLSLARKMITRRDPQIALLWLLSFAQGSSYDPAKYRLGRHR